MPAESPAQPGVIQSLGVSALAACIAETVTLPLDTAKVRRLNRLSHPHPNGTIVFVILFARNAPECHNSTAQAKVRLQLQNKRTISGPPPYRGPLQTIRVITQKEGFGALFKQLATDTEVQGLEAGLHRQFIFTGLRIGLYGHILDAFSGGQPRDEVGTSTRVATALCTSAVGISLANASDVVKVRTQAAGASEGLAAVAAAPPQSAAGHSTRSTAAATPPAAAASGAAETGGKKRLLSTSRAASAAAPDGLYRGSSLRVYGHIIRTEGFFGGLYAGYVPNLLRNSIISTSELVVYDVSKRIYNAQGVAEGPLLHLFSGLSAGLVATVLGSPMDVVSTRIMVNKQKGISAGMLKTCGEMFRMEGMFSFYQGFVPNFVRIGSFNIVLWMSYEQLRKTLL